MGSLFHKGGGSWGQYYLPLFLCYTQPMKRKNLTKLEQERIIKKEIGQETEELEATGQESDAKAVKWIQELQKDEDKKLETEEAIVQEKLHAARGKVFTYKDTLFNYMKSLKHSFDIPEGFRWDCIKTSKGLTLWIRDHNGNWYARGTKVCGELKYDMNAVQRILIDGIDFMESFAKKESDILLP